MADAAPNPPPASSEAPPAPPKRRGPPLRVLAILAVLALFGGGFYYVTHAGVETTDNAYIEGHVVTLGPRVPGVVKEVLVGDNQVVKAGDVLVKLDDADLAVRLRMAQADLAAAEAARDAAQAQLLALTGNTSAGLSAASAGVDSAKAGASGAEAAVAQARAALDSARARAAQAAADRQRAETLLPSGGVTKQAYDALVSADVAAQAALAQAQAGLDASQQSVAAAQGRLDEARARYAQATTGDAQVAAAAAQVRAAEARVQQAQAAVDAASLNLSYTQLVAPFDGVVAKRSAEPGQVVGAGSALVGLVGTHELWVSANFKETQLEGISVGDEVELTVDALPGSHYVGHVQGVSGATGARFSLLPPDNASGNFTKVVQRIPVRIDLPPEAVAALRPGMSAVVKVHLGD